MLLLTCRLILSPAGYMSDTDGVSEDPRYDTVMDGYMSEDGLYARSHAQVKYSR